MGLFQTLGMQIFARTPSTLAVEMFGGTYNSYVVEWPWDDSPPAQ